MIDEVVLPDADRYTLDEVSARAGTDPELSRRLWRALGFADPDGRIGPGQIPEMVKTFWANYL